MTKDTRSINVSSPKRPIWQHRRVSFGNAVAVLGPVMTVLGPLPPEAAVVVVVAEGAVRVTWGNGRGGEADEGPVVVEGI